MKILNIKTKNRLTGDIGEKYAIGRLKKSGYKILEKNYVADNNEIDIICENKDTLAFVEVKTRTLINGKAPEVRPAAAVTKEKRRAIIKTAAIYLSDRFCEKMKRFDIIEVLVDKNGKVTDYCHIENAFNLNSSYGG